MVIPCHPQMVCWAIRCTVREFCQIVFFKNHFFFPSKLFVSERLVKYGSNSLKKQPMGKKVLRWHCRKLSGEGGGLFCWKLEVEHILSWVSLAKGTLGEWKNISTWKKSSEAQSCLVCILEMVPSHTVDGKKSGKLTSWGEGSWTPHYLQGF